MINWALYVDIEVLRTQVRVGPFLQLSLEENPFIDFLTTSLAVDPEGFISNSDLVDLLDDHFKSNALQPLTGASRRRVPAIILDLLRTMCGCYVRNIHGQKRGIKGVRRLDSEKDIPVSIRASELKPLNLDPFTYSRIVPYEELSQVFDVQLESKTEDTDLSSEALPAAPEGGP